VADDCAVVRTSIRRLLQSCGCEVDEVVDGRTALEQMRRRVYDVFLVDVQMPELDGAEAVRAVRAVVPEGDRPRLIVMSEELGLESREVFLDGADGFLAKPMRLAELARAVGGRAEAVGPWIGLGAD
jgi:CheY-like chemotaxis protein